MAVPSDTVQTFAMVGIREDLSDVIMNITPTETPFFAMIRKGTCKARTPEWQSDTDAAVDTANYVVEGDAAANDAGSHPTRLKNVVQLMDKVVEVSTSAQAVDTAGRGNELKYQMAKKGRELKRDIESRLTSNTASVLGNASTAGRLGGMGSWITTNDDRGSGGSDGGFNTGTGLTVAATDGTQRAFTETILKAVIRQAWSSGGDPGIVLVGPVNKQRASAFAGIATQYRDSGQSKKAVVIMGAADIYVSDFGEHRIVPSRYTPERTAHIIDPKTWALLFLQAMKTEPLAKLGHSDRRMLSCEVTLKCSEERANGVAADLTTT